MIEGYVDERLDPSVAAAFAGALARLAKAGAKLTPLRLPELAELPHIYRNGSIVDFEAFAAHRARIEAMGADYDPWVLGRLEAGRGKSAADYTGLLADRTRVRAAVDARTARLRRAGPADGRRSRRPRLPTLAMSRRRAQSTRSSCAIPRSPISSIGRRSRSPATRAGDAPVGFMLMGETGLDRRLLAAAQAAEETVRAARSDRPGLSAVNVVRAGGSAAEGVSRRNRSGRALLTSSHELIPIFAKSGNARPSEAKERSFGFLDLLRRIEQLLKQLWHPLGQKIPFYPPVPRPLAFRPLLEWNISST